MTQEHPEHDGAELAAGGPDGTEHRFEVRVTGAVPDAVLGQVAGIELVTREILTAVRVRLRDQAELHGFLATLRTYGLEVIEVRRLATSRGEAPGSEPS